MQEIEVKGRDTMLKAIENHVGRSERPNSNLPAPGSRVRRGPDWRYDDKQDRHMPGTIVGHVDDGKNTLCIQFMSAT